MVVLRAEQPDLPAFTDLRFGDHGVMLGRPALGFTELSARAQREHRPIKAQAELDQRRVAAGGFDLQAGFGIRARQLGASVVGQRHEALDHQRVTLFVEGAHVVEQAIAKLATPAGAFGNTGEERHQRRLQRVGQQNRLIVLTLEGFADAPACGQLQRAMAEREAQGRAHFRHALKDRPAPLGRQHIDLALRVTLLQALEQRLRHHHVTDPAGPYDQNSHALPKTTRNEQGGPPSSVMLAHAA